MSSIPSASLWENLVYNLGYLIPTALQGTFTRSRFWVGFWSRVHPDPATVRLVHCLRRKYRSDAIYLWMLTTRTLLVLDRDVVQSILKFSPAQYIGAKAKRDGMAHFQPDAVTISSGAQWHDRRRFNEEVLDFGRLHRFASRFLSVVGEEIAPPNGPAPPLRTWDDFDGLFARIMRRVIFGDAAREDTEISQLLRVLMREANRPLGRKNSRHFDAFYERIRQYLTAPAPQSLAALCAATPSAATTKVANQIPHWMFAMWETLGANTVRAIALILAHSAAERRVREEMANVDLTTPAGIDGLKYLEGCVQETMRLWPTTPMLVRQTVVQPLLGGEAVPTGTQLLILNSFNHRDAERDPYADCFAPERWADGAPNPLFNHLSSGTQVCAGKDLALFLAKAVLATVLRRGRLTLVTPKFALNRPFPHAFDYFRVRFESPPSGRAAPVIGGRTS